MSNAEMDFPPRDVVETRLAGRIPHDRFGMYLDIPDGWMSLVSMLDLDIARTDPDYVLYQVKEKFGGLRYYIKDHSAHGELIVRAERQSFQICQTCGRDGELRQGLRWIRTLCDEHAKEAKEDERA